MSGWAVSERVGATEVARRGAEALRVEVFARDGWAAEAGEAARFRRRLAHQVRRDLWRALRRVRGFAPVVRVEGPEAGRVTVEAGGRLARSGAEAQVRAAAAALLADLALRRRWTAFAARPLARSRARR
ncbi:MAG: hypothetical protein AAF763_02190 [Pseudomonadota bacterium]